jgi:GMP synthase-like glutamine amidotransferase
MRVLAVINHDLCDAGVFGDEVIAGDHEFEDWLPSQGPLPRPLADYDAVISFGGGMQADQDERHPWIRTVLDVLHASVEREVPTLGVCLGGQMLARAAGGAVGPAPQAEAGFDEIELTEAGQQDPLFTGLSRTLPVYQWHSYSFGLPPHGVALASSPVCLQAFRVGSRAWGLQWHPEVRAETALMWAQLSIPAVNGVPVDIDPAQLAAAVSERMQQANEDGRELCRRFLRIAEQARAD